MEQYLKTPSLYLGPTKREALNQEARWDPAQTRTAAFFKTSRKSLMLNLCENELVFFRESQRCSRAQHNCPASRFHKKVLPASTLWFQQVSINYLLPPIISLCIFFAELKLSLGCLMCSLSFLCCFSVCVREQTWKLRSPPGQEADAASARPLWPGSSERCAPAGGPVMYRLCIPA